MPVSWENIDTHLELDDQLNPVDGKVTQFRSKTINYSIGVDSCF